MILIVDDVAPSLEWHALDSHVNAKKRKK